ncbi:MAG: glycoside hydrolase family 127 protein [Anaerolineae bacterium]|nr:glycoside hydrolase family 127 protein [Anaerolineae bacterium]
MLPIVVDTSVSPAARLKPVPLTAVTLADEFWAPRRRINREVTIPSQYRLLEETGRLDNFRRAAGQNAIPFEGRFFNDSDVYKWLEAASWTLSTDRDPGLTTMTDTVVDLVSAAQQPDGYLNTYFMFERAAERWINIRDMHELYCAGHLIQAAVAHHRATGSNCLLGIARRLADHIDAVFGSPEAGKRPTAPGHPEVEMALVELARTTGEPKYRRLAQFFVDNRGRGLIGGHAYHVDHQPLREMDLLAGHAVRALYLCAGAADLCAESGEAALRTALDRLWSRMVARQIYVSGGLGARHDGEAFGDVYELPNARAYAETCAAIASVMWSWRMLALDGQGYPMPTSDARYADLMETVLYNAVLPGLSLDGLAYFYVNPLADYGPTYGRRQPWFDCACCPPNIARLLAYLPSLFYSLSAEGVWLHLYAEGTARLQLAGGQTITLAQHTRYPWDGEVVVEVQAEGSFRLFVRIPAWCDADAALEVNGRPFAGTLVAGSYAEVRRPWQPGDQVRLSLPMPVRRVECHLYVADNVGQVALLRGPLLYCVEGVDNPGLDPRDLVLPAGGEFSVTFRPDLLGGVVTLRGPAAVVSPADHWEGCLYCAVHPGGRALVDPAGSDRVDLAAIPYYAWANRQPGPMQVWLRAEPVRG